MRHSQPKPNYKSSNVSTNVKNANLSQKCTGSGKRVSNDIRDQAAKKSRKPGTSEASVRKTNLPKGYAYAEKTQRRCNSTVLRKAVVNLKRNKKPNEKYKKIASKIDKRTKAYKNALKKVTKTFEKKEEHEGPPTLCETFSRITTMVAETVINEKENLKLTEGYVGKSKKENASPEKSVKDTNNADTAVAKVKGEPGSADSLTSKIKSDSSGSSDSAAVKSKKELPKVAVKTKLVSPKGKAQLGKPKTNVKKGNILKNPSVKKVNEKQGSEPSTKMAKEDESPVSGRGITTRRVSAPGSPESDKEAEVKVENDKQKVVLQGSSNTMKGLNIKKSEKTKIDKKSAIITKCTTKRKDNTRIKTESKEKKPKINDSHLPVKKIVEESKSLNKDKDEEMPQECSYKKASKNSSIKKNIGRHCSRLLLKTNNTIHNKKASKIEELNSKTMKSKMGSETDGSNSDELTLNVIQKKAKKSEKMEISPIKVKSERASTPEDVKVKVEGKMESTTKQLIDKNVKSKKGKAEKDEGEMPLKKKILEEILKKRRSKETESDTDEDMELRRILAKKFGKKLDADNSPQMKRKRLDEGQSDSDQRARRLRLFGFWSGPKRHRVASLNAIAKVHCLYENESKGVMAEIEKMGQILKPDTKVEKKPTKKTADTKKEMDDSESEKLESIVVNKRRLRGTPGTRGAGKHWDMFATEFTSTSCPSSDESHSDTDFSKDRPLPLPPSYRQKMQKKEESDKEVTVKTPKRRRKADIGITMDLKDMVVRKRMASLNASAILAASYSSEKRSTRKDSSGTSTEDGLSSFDEGRGDFLSADESDSGKKSGEKSYGLDGGKTGGSQSGDDHKRRKNFWKTKLENLKKASKEKRNSPSPILADFGVGRDLSVTVMEKEKKDEMNDDRERDKGNGSCKVNYSRKHSEIKSKSKGVPNKSVKDKGLKKESYKSGKEGSSYSRKNLTKRKAKDGEVKNINIEKVNGSEKSDEYEYKSDSDNGQRKLIELRNTGGSNKKVAVIVNQDTDVTITGVYVNSTRSTHHEGFCSIAGMQYRISSTSHTQTEATAVLKTSIASEQVRLMCYH